jgi:ribulose-phosphate 3-epimerase
MIEILPSILSADFARLGDQVAQLEAAGCRSLDIADSVLVMSVNPGFGGRAFIPNSLHKVRQLARRKTERGLPFDIEIDGGITHENVEDAIRAGVEWVVARSSIFHSVNPGNAFEEMRQNRS